MTSHLPTPADGYGMWVLIGRQARGHLCRQPMVERYYGDNYSGSFKHNSRLTRWVASYAEAITSVRDMQLANHAFGFVDSSGNANVVNVTFPALTPDTFILKHSDVSMSRKLRSGTLVIELYNDKRIYQSTGDHEEQYGNHSSLSWSLDERRKLDISGGWERYNYRSGNRSDDLWYASLGVSRQISKKLSSEVQYQYISRNSTEKSSDYGENRISAYIHATF